MNTIAGKVALITGGGSGIGLCYAKELLRNGLKAVTLADVNPDNGNTAVQQINKEFGTNRALFIKTDVTDKGEYENALKATVSQFQNIDILVNNAGIMNDSVWEKQININLVGTIHGCLLALENYLLKHRADKEGIVVNISSIAGLGQYSSFPIYAGTKHAIIGLTRAWGSENHYCRTKVRFLTLCPGVTDTPLVHECYDKTLGNSYRKILTDHLPKLQTQPAEAVAKALVHIINKGGNGSVWVAEHNELPYEVDIPSRQEMKKKAT